MNNRERNLEDLLYALEDAQIYLSRLGLDESDDYKTLQEMINKYTEL